MLGNGSIGAGLRPFVTRFDYYARNVEVYPPIRGGRSLSQPLEVFFGSEEPGSGRLCEAYAECGDGISVIWDQGLGFHRQHLRPAAGEDVPGATGSGANTRGFGWIRGGKAQQHRAVPGHVLFGSLADKVDGVERGNRAASNSSWRLELVNGAYVVTLELSQVNAHYMAGCLLNGHEVSDGWWGPNKGTFRQHWWTIVTSGYLEVMGSLESCGSLKYASVQEVLITAGNILCWDKEYQYHTCCLSAEGRAKCFPQDARGEPSSFTFASCCRRQHSSQVLDALPLLKHQPRGCVPPYCQTACLGYGPEHYSTLPTWIRNAPWRLEPLRCGGDVKLWPLTYSVPRELVVECIPPKSADFALLHPGDPATYIFGDDAAEYYRGYREAVFAKTSTKGGADCARHTEILASGAVPYFVDLHKVPSHTMAHHHHELLARALELPGTNMGFLDDSTFDAQAWLETASALLQWTTHRLTTDAMASYVLSVLGVEPSARSALRVLYIWHNPPMPIFLLHGLRGILTPANVVDFPRHEFFYEPLPWPLGSRPTAAPGKGQNYLSARWSLRRTAVFADGEAEVLQALERRLFDYVIFAQLPEEPEAGLRPVEKMALDMVPKESLVLIDAHDHMPTTLARWAQRVGTTFKYNLADTCV